MLRGMIDAWGRLVITGGGLITAAAVMLCLAPGDYLMALIVGFLLVVFFMGLYMVPRVIARRVLRKPLVRTFYHKMDDGATLIETVRIR